MARAMGSSVALVEVSAVVSGAVVLRWGGIEGVCDWELIASGKDAGLSPRTSSVKEGGGAAGSCSGTVRLELSSTIPWFCGVNGEGRVGEVDGCGRMSDVLEASGRGGVREVACTTT